MTTATILVVEDEAITAKDIQATLRDLGYAVCGTVASGAEALQKADADRPGHSIEQERAERLALIRDAYAMFRDKWGIVAPADYSPAADLRAIVAAAERAAPPQPEFRLPESFWDQIERL